MVFLWVPTFVFLGKTLRFSRKHSIGLDLGSLCIRFPSKDIIPFEAQQVSQGKGVQLFELPNSRFWFVFAESNQENTEIQPKHHWNAPRNSQGFVAILNTQLFLPLKQVWKWATWRRWAASHQGHFQNHANPGGNELHSKHANKKVIKFSLQTCGWH